MNHVRTYMQLAMLSSRKAGPYLLLEIFLPGGTLFALCLLLYRRHRSKALKPALVWFPRGVSRPQASASVDRPRTPRFAGGRARALADAE